MLNRSLRKLRYAILSSALMAVSSAFAGDPGDLFPDVNYDKAVSSPVSAPDRVIIKQETPAYVTPRASAKPPAPTVTHVPNNPANPANPANPKDPKDPVAVKQPETPAAGNQVADAQLFTDKNPVYKIWGPYRLFTLKKFLSPDEQIEFDKDFSDSIKKALATNQKDRQIAIEALTEASAHRSAALKRYVLLSVVGLAIKNNSTLADRAERAMNVLPLLTDQTLETMQAKADCIYNLAMSAPEQANDTLWSMLVESEATLSMLQVQSGFPKQGLESLQKARVAYNRMYDRNAVRSELMVEAAAWVEYANGASAQVTRMKTTLAAKPKDPDASNRLAMAYAVIYADLDAAEEYAVNSNKDAVKTLGNVLHEMDFPKVGNDANTVVAKSLKIAESVLAVGKQAPEQIERFALATLVMDRLDDLKEAYPTHTDNNLTTLYTEARELMTANEYKPIPAPKVPPKPEPVAQNNNNNNGNNNQPNWQNQNQQQMQNFSNRLQQFMQQRNNNGNNNGFSRGRGRGGRG